MPKKLPLGLQDFRGIIEDGYKYIDKTYYLHRMATSGKYFFLSRPRRFGKSITIATLQEMYLGSRELFGGLWIEDKWNWTKRHPIIRMSLTSIGFQSIGLSAAIAQELRLVADTYKVQLESEGLAAQFRELIRKLATPDAKTVVLIDEYDTPIIHYLGVNLDQAIENRSILREFYTVLKDSDPFLELVFLTGVSKFSKTGIFSGLNNLVDLTMHPDYATMLGYTQEELEANFSEEMAVAAASLKLSLPELLIKLREWYNGYRFEENAPTVYNPISINYFFSQKKFDNFWFSTGTPTFLIQLLKQNGIFDLHVIGQTTLDFDSFELEDIRLFGLLYQTGYLTIQSRDEFGQYILDYPNREVKHAMLAYLLEAFGGVSKGTGVSMAIQLERAFIADDLAEVFRILQEMFSHIPYFLHERYPEKFFHAAIHLLFTYMGIRVRSEVCTSHGRADSLVETPTRVYLLEYKLDKSPEEALLQIRSKQYYRAAWGLGKPITAVGVQFSSQTKNIEDWKSEEY